METGAFARRLVDEASKGGGWLLFWRSWLGRPDWVLVRGTVECGVLDLVARRVARSISRLEAVRAFFELEAMVKGG